ncbi:MAG: hypothetical protein ABSA27_07090 [Terriglobales bacterium]|jgi:hypothetical protein
MTLAENDCELERHPERPDLWVTKARLLMLEENPVSLGLDEVETCLLKALGLDPEHLDALEEAAHFYDVVMPDRAKAVMYAQHYIRVAGKVVDDMQSIIDDLN